MATALDIGLVGYFSVIFPVLLIFVVSYAILSKSKIFGDNNGIYSLIAFAISMMLLFSPDVVKIIAVMAPWFILIFLFFVFGMILLQFMGVEAAKITNYMSSDWTAVHWIVLGLAMTILIGSIGVVFGQSLLPFSSDSADGVSTVSGADGSGFDTDTGDFNQNVARTLFHPKVLGLIFLFFIGAATIRMLTQA